MKDLKKLKAVIFDLDGVITETSALHTKAWKKMTEEENIPFDEVTADKLRGVSREKSLEIILEDAKNRHDFQKKYTEEEFNRMMDRKNKYYIKSLSSITPKDKLPGAQELIDFFKSQGYKVAIGSSSKNAEIVINNLEIEDQLDAIVNGTEIEHSKPHPEIFRLAAGKLGLAYEQCLVVEDAASGVKSARSGGMASVGIGPAERFAEPDEQPDFRFDDMQAFNKGKNSLYRFK